MAGTDKAARENRDPQLKSPEPSRDDLLKHHVPEDETESTRPGPGTGLSSIGSGKRGGLRGLLQILGPGLVTGASDDDPSGIATYSQVGSQFGYGLLWTALFTFPLMAGVEELCARIALQTGVGLGTALRRKFPTWLVGVCIFGLFCANTINLGADLAAVATGFELLSKGWLKEIWLVVPVGAGILAMQLFSTYDVIFRTFKWLTLTLFAYVFAAFLAHPKIPTMLVATVIPSFQAKPDYITALVAVLGTTISPYLFFWQASSEVEEMRAEGKGKEHQRRGVRKAELNVARIDVLVGMFFSQVVMYCIILTTAAVLNAHGKTGVQTAAQAAQALQPFAGPFAFVLFAVGLIGTGLLAIPIFSGSAAYAIKEFLGLPGTLETKPRYRPTFYLIIAIATVIGIALNFLHIDPIKALFWTAVINGLVAPPLLVLIVLLGSDQRFMEKEVSGWKSKSLTWAATMLMGAAAIVMMGVNWVLPHFR
jgi:NRAMP (natural resistance-associated macrophage protein)-like metal ion transporter